MSLFCYLIGNKTVLTILNEMRNDIEEKVKLLDENIYYMDIMSFHLRHKILLKNRGQKKSISFCVNTLLILRRFTYLNRMLRRMHNGSLARAWRTLPVRSIPKRNREYSSHVPIC
jgi:hypothetical protein